MFFTHVWLDYTVIAVLIRKCKLYHTRKKTNWNYQVSQVYIIIEIVAFSVYIFPKLDA